MFFECSLPMYVPAHVQGTAKRERIDEILKNIHSRMDKLNAALDMTSMCGEQFSAGAKILFDLKADNGESVIDTMTAEALANRVVALASNLSYTTRHEWKNANVVVDTAFLSTPEWEAIRTISIGGSDAARVMEVSPYGTIQELYHDKVGTEFKIPDTDSGKKFIFEFGHKVESLVIDEFCRRTGAVVIPETRMFSKKDMPFVTANIDAIVKLPDGKLAIFEAKTTTNFNRDAWNDGKIPVQYLPQCRQYMAVLDDPDIAGTYIGCIYGNTPSDFRCSFVKRDMQRESEQLLLEEEFWNEFVLVGEEPEPSGNSEQDIELARRLSGYADKSEPAVELDSEYKNIIEEYMKLSEEKKLMEKKTANMKERLSQLSLGLINELGTATKGTLAVDSDSFYEVSYTPVSRTSIDTDKLKLCYPEIYNELKVVNPESSRRFSIKKKAVKKKSNEK